MNGGLGRTPGIPTGGGGGGLTIEEVNAQFIRNDDLEIVLPGELAVEGPASFNDGIAVDGLFQVTSTTAGFTGALSAASVEIAGATLTDTLTVANDATFQGDVDFGGAVTGMGPAAVGLGNVDNTSDANKPVSTAQAAADALKLNLTGGTMSGVIVITKTAGSAMTARVTGDAQARLVIGTDGKLTLGDGTTTGDTNLYRAAAGNALQTDDSLIVGADLTVTGTVTGAGFTKALVGLSNVDNTADTAKPVSTATQTALDLKAPLASPTFTGTVSGVTAAMVGLGNVDNTSDASKPVSTAQAAADALKLNLTGGTLTGGVVINNSAASSYGILLTSSNATGHGIGVSVGALANTYTYVIVAGETQKRLTINGEGKMLWGSGAATGDTTLYRGGTDTLSTDDSFTAVGNITGCYGTANALGLTATGLAATGTGTDQSVWVQSKGTGAVIVNNGTNSGTGGFGVYSGGASPVLRAAIGPNRGIDLSPAASNDGLRLLKSGESQYRFLINDDGTLRFGSGAATPDVTLYRGAADTLKTDDALLISTNQAGVFAATVQNTNATGHGLSLSTGASTNFGFGSTVVGDNFYRYIVDCAGKIQWGDGNVAVDTSLYRDGVDLLRTNDEMRVDLALTAGYAAASTANVKLGAVGPSSVAGVIFGGDINLYRSSSTVLQCDKSLYATTNIAARSASGQGAVTIGNVGAGSTAGILFGTDANLYRSAADTLKTDDTLIVGSGLATVGSTAAGSTGLTLTRLASGVTAATHHHIPTSNSPTYQYLMGGTWSGEAAGTTNDTFAFYQSAVPSAQTMTLGRISLGAAGAFTSSDMSARLTITNLGVRIDNYVGFYGTTPAAKSTVSGSRGGNAALASLLTALAAIGLITDSSSA